MWHQSVGHSRYIQWLHLHLSSLHRKEGNTSEHGLGANVVHTLIGYLHNTYRHVYFYNYFSGVDLLGLLLTLCTAVEL